MYHTIRSYSYLATVPLLVIFSVAMTALKFLEGLSLPLKNSTLSYNVSGYSMLPSGKSAWIAWSSVQVAERLISRSETSGIMGT